MPSIEELYGEYKSKGVEFFVVYSKEPHPGERAFKQYKQHASYEHKAAYARELAQAFGMKVPVLVDGLDEATVKAFGGMPNMVFVIDLEGKIAYEASWTDRPRLDKVLDDLLAEQAAAPAAAAAS